MPAENEPRDIIRLWLEHLQSKYGVKPRGLATKANIAPATIYRWLDPNAHFQTSLSKLRQVADAFGEPLPPGLIDGSGTIVGAFSEGDLVPYDASEMPLPERPHVNHGRWRITSKVLDLEGFRIGDVVQFDFTAKAGRGDIVVAQVYDDNAGAAETVLRVYQPPYLLTRSSDPDIDQRVLPVDGDKVRIVGTFDFMIRRRLT